MTDKLRGAFHGCLHHGDDYEACIQYSGKSPCHLSEDHDALTAHVERLRNAIEPMIHSGTWVGDRKLVRNASRAITEEPETSITTRKETLDAGEEEYWKRCAEDSDLSFWAEVEGAYRRACARTEYGSFCVDQWVTMAGAVKEAIDRYHGRKEKLSSMEIKQLVEDIRGGNQ